MASREKFLSIKTLFVWVVMAITTVAVILSSAIYLINQISNYQNELIQQVEVYSELIGRSAAVNIIADDSYIEEQNLKALVVATFVNSVHIYRDNGDEQPSFFTSYNRPGFAPLNEKWNRIDELKTPKLSGSVYEVIKPIRQDGDLVGYVYLQVSAEVLNTLTWNSVVTTVLVLVVVLILSFGLTLKLQHTLVKPIIELVNLVQKISRQRDYTGRAKTTNIRELDILASAFNNMLDMTQHYLIERDQAEQEQQKLQISLEDKVNQRTLALKEANQELIQTLEKLHQFQRQMVQNEKMASLGDMVAGVAHEVNTPIGLGVTASTMMLDKLKLIEKEFNQKSLKASTLAKFIAEGQENLDIIYRNLNRAAELISSFKQVAVDQSSEDNRVFNFAQLVDETLLSMRPKLKKVKHKVHLECDKDLLIETKAGPINQILMNLIMNSIIHGFEFIEQGNIYIKVKLVDNNKISLHYADDGKGIPEQLKKRIFDPFVTTKRGQGGSGLGMHLVYNLVTQALNGSITVASEEDAGIEIQILFPVRKVENSSFDGASLLK